MTLTKGNIVVEDIKIGDIHYEFEYGIGIKSEVISLPVRDNDGLLTWESKNLNNLNNIIKYAINEKYYFYGPNLYNYEAYKVNDWLK